MRFANHSADRRKKVGADQWLGNDLMHAQGLGSGAVGTKTGPELSGYRDQRDAGMRGLNGAQRFMPGLLGHIDAGDHKIRWPQALRFVQSASMDTVSRLAQPFAQQVSRELVFLVDHDVHYVFPSRRRNLATYTTVSRKARAGLRQVTA